MHKIWKKTENNLLKIFNMALAIFAGVCVGMLLSCLGTSQLIVCGAVAITSTITEHYLTIYPLPFFSKQIEDGEDDDIEEIL